VVAILFHCIRTSGLYGRQSGLALQGDGATGRFDMGGMVRSKKKKYQ
jgi:hypothetical protein